ncbi:MAG: S1 family peptidase [Bryobacterales bacterium]|nr:S1 family peptidase [Bryobacterales bacterium]
MHKGIPAAFFAATLCGNTLPDGKLPRDIIGGEATSVQEFPFVVLLEMRNIGKCTGTVIEPAWILTAAHCVEDARTDQVFVWHETEATEQGRPAVRLTVHPRYDTHTGENDIAVVKIGEPFQAAPVGVADWSGVGEVGTIVGYGAMERNQEATGMNKVRLRVLDPVKYGYGGGSTLFTLAIGQGPNYGDSGGPLLIAENSGHMQVGVTSQGTFESEYDSIRYSVYTRVSAFRPWIREQLAERRQAPVESNGNVLTGAEAVLDLAGYREWLFRSGTPYLDTRDSSDVAEKVRNIEAEALGATVRLSVETIGWAELVVNWAWATILGDSALAHGFMDAAMTVQESHQAHVDKVVLSNPRPSLYELFGTFNEWETGERRTYLVLVLRSKAQWVDDISSYMPNDIDPTGYIRQRLWNARNSLISTSEIVQGLGE